jgi:hypothetical protein
LGFFSNFLFTIKKIIQTFLFETDFYEQSLDAPKSILEIEKTLETLSSGQIYKKKPKTPTKPKKPQKTTWLRLKKKLGFFSNPGTRQCSRAPSPPPPASSSRRSVWRMCRRVAPPLCSRGLTSASSATRTWRACTSWPVICASHATSTPVGPSSQISAAAVGRVGNKKPTQKTHLKNPLKMFFLGFLGFFKIFYFL